MIVIGELINGTRKAVAAAIEQRDMTYIQELATRQAAAGAAFIDCNAGTPGDRERNDMVWIVKAVQEVVTLPLAIDSPNPQVVVAGLEAYTGHETPMVNSVSLEQDRLDQLLPIVVERQTNVVVLCMDDHGVPSQPGKREEIAKQLIDKCVEAGLPPNHLFVDPVVTTQAPDPTTGSLILQAIAAIREFAPEVHITGGLSNISYGLPHRRLLNRVFVTLCMGCGLDSGILDPTDKALMASICAAEALLGHDDYCMNYINAARGGKLMD